VYKRNAKQLTESLGETYPDIQVESAIGRSKSFECVLIKEDGTEVLVWSGIKKGPPRKQKFPDPAVIINAIKKEI